MVDVVDSIVAELIVRDVDKYEAGFHRATAAHEKFLASTGKLQRQTFDLGAEGRKYKAGAAAMADGSEQADQRITRSRKKRAADAKAVDETEVASTKKAAREKVQAAEAAARATAAAEKRYYSQGPKIFEAKAKEIKARNDAARAATAEANATAAAAKKAADAEVAAATRIRAAAERAVAGRSIPQGSAAFRAGRTVPREGLGMAPAAGGAETVASAAAAATGAAAAEKEVNHLLADQAVLQSRLSGLKGKDLEYAKDQLAELRLTAQLQRAGIADDEIALRLEQRRALVEAQRGRSIKANLLSEASRFAEGAGLRRTGGGGAAIAGIATAAAAGIGAAAIQSALDYGKALQNVSDQLGVTIEDLQAYQKMARDAGVSQEQLTSAFGQFANNLGRAKEGEQDQIKVFKALGVNIRDFAKAGDALPTVIDRISQIKDPAQRAAIETRLFGESGRRLDTLLSGGAEKISALAASLQETGQALSSQEIKDLDDTARKLAAVKAELQVDFARIVAGNAASIIGLANSFATLAGQIGNALLRLREFDLEQRAQGGITGLGLGQSQGDRDAAGAELRKLRLGSAAGRATLARNNLAKLDSVLFGEGGPKGTGSLDAQRGAMIRYIRSKPNSPIAQQVEGLLSEQHDIRVAAGNGRATPTAPVQLGKINPGALANLGTPKGPKGKSAEQLAKEADQRQRRYEEELGRAQDDLLQAQRDLTGSAERRYEIDVESENTALARRKQEIQREANEKQIDGSRVKELQDAEAAASAERLKVLALEKSVRLESDANALRQQMLDAEVEMLSLQEGLADSTSERQEIAARRLAAERRAETASLNAIITSTDPNVSAGERALAQNRLDSQGDRFAARAAQDERANESPFEAYRRALNRSPGQIRDQVEALVVDELGSVRDGITGALTKALGTKDPLITGLLNLLIENVLMKPIAAALAKNGEGGGGLLGTLAGLFGGGAGGGSGTASSVGSTLASIGGSLARRAGGGNVVAGVPYLVGENGPEPVVFGASGRVFPNGAMASIGAGGGGAPTVIAPQHFDLSGVVMTESLIRQLDARNRAYANAVAAQAGRAAVAAGPGRMQKLSDLGS